MSIKIYPKDVWISQITGRVMFAKPESIDRHPRLWAHYKLVQQTAQSPEQKRSRSRASQDRK